MQVFEEIESNEKEESLASGFLTCDGYIGYVPKENRYILFATYEDYEDYIMEGEL